MDDEDEVLASQVRQLGEPAIRELHRYLTAPREAADGCPASATRPTRARRSHAAPRDRERGRGGPAPSTACDQGCVGMGEGDEVESFIAGSRVGGFDKRARQAYGIGKGERVSTFVLARVGWTLAWERCAMSAIAVALKTHGLTRLTLLRWDSHPRGLSLEWDVHVEAEGREAEELLGRSDAWPRWLGVLLWATEDDATKVMVEEGEQPALQSELSDDLESDWRQADVLLFKVWGERTGEVLDVLLSAARRAEDHFSES